MIAWFEKKAPIRIKYRVLTGLQVIWGVAGLAGVWLASRGGSEWGYILTVLAFGAAVLTDSGPEGEPESARGDSALREAPKPVGESEADGPA